MRARNYVPKWGVFTSPDPLSIAAAPSLYSFTGARPLAFRDPMGLSMTPGGSRPPTNGCDGNAGAFGCTGGSNTPPPPPAQDPPPDNTTVAPPNNGPPMPYPPPPDPPEPPPGKITFGPSPSGGAPERGTGGGRRSGPPRVSDFPPGRVFAGDPVMDMAEPWLGGAAAAVCPECILAVGGVILGGYLVNEAVEAGKEWWTNYAKKKKESGTPKEAREKVKKKQGPREIDRIDAPNQRVPKSQWHAHRHDTKGGLNQDGSFHDGKDPEFGNQTLRWLRDHGWKIPWLAGDDE